MNKMDSSLIIYRKHIYTVMTITLLLVIIAITLGCSEGDSFKDGFYINNEYHFSLRIPNNWQSIPEEEAIKCPNLRSLNGLNNRLHITPSNPDNAAMIVSVLSITEKQFKAIPWHRYINTLKSISNMNIEKDTLENIGGFEVHKISGSLREYHNGLMLFTSQGKLMQIYYWLKKPLDKNILTEIDNIFYSLQKI